MSRLGIDATFMAPGQVGGAEHMIKNLVQGFASSRIPWDELLVFADHPWHVSDATGLRWVQPHGRGNRFVKAWVTTRSFTHHLDSMLFANYYTPPIVRRRRPWFVTVLHDLQYLHFPENFSRRKRWWLRAAHETTLRVADVVVVISDAVRRDVLERYGIRWDHRVEVIPNPVSWERFGESPGKPPPDAPDPGRRVLLSVAAHYPHKNLSTLLGAFALLRRRRGFDDVLLVLVGQLGARLRGIAWHPRVQDTIADLGLDDGVLITGYVTEDELGWWYRRASVFAFPSRFEGFGLPPVEALGFGLPVLTTRCASIPEVTLGLAAYVDDPRDPAEMAERLAEMLDRPEAFRPAAADVASIRDAYDPARIAARYVELLAPGSRDS